MDTAHPFDNQAPWTTTRCNRLLRPISSRLVALRKYTQDRRSVTLENGTNHFGGRAKPIAQAEKRVKIPQASKDVRPRDFDKEQDPDWMPKPQQDGIVRRMLYKGKGSRPQVKPNPTRRAGAMGRPGDVCLPTPYITRSLGKLQDSPQIQPSPLQRTGRQKPRIVKPKDDLQAMKKQMPPDMWKQINGLYDGFSNLLQATKAPTDKSRKGTRSLLSMCMRQIPEYIRLEEHFLKEDGNDEDADTANDIYSHLEDHGAARHGIGWKPLREVVRAHAVSLLREAIEDRILVPSIILGLYRLCMNASAWNEAEEFLSSYLLYQGRIAPPKELHSDLFGLVQSSCWSTINEFATRTGRHQFLFEQLRLALAYDLLPTEWLATQGMRPLWTRIVRVLSEKDHRTYANAFGVLESAVISGIGLSDTLSQEPEASASSDEQSSRSRELSKPEIQGALSNTFSSLFTLLPSIVSVAHQRSDGTHEDTVKSISWALLGITTTVFTRFEIDVRHSTEAEKAYPQRALYAIAALFLLRVEGIILDPALIAISLDKHIQAIDQLCTTVSSRISNAVTPLETLPHLVCSAARCFGRASQNDGYDHLEKLVRCLADPPRNLSAESQWFTKRVALAASMKFAEKTEDAAYVLFAHEIEKTVQDTGPVLLERTLIKTDSPNPIKKRKGFRWEDGICEWVACTPFTRPQVRQTKHIPFLPSTFPPTPIDSESEPDTPRTRGSINGRNSIATATPSLSPELQPRVSPSVTPSDSSPNISLISNIMAQDVSSSSNKRRLSPSVPISKRRRTEYFGPAEATTADSSACLFPRANLPNLGSRRAEDDFSANRKRRSLVEIAVLVSKLKTGREQPKVQITSKLTTAKRSRCQNPDSTFRSKGRSRITEDATQLCRRDRRSAGDASAVDPEDSEEDELSIAEVRMPNVGEVKKPLPRSGLRRTVSARSAPRKRGYWEAKGLGWDDSEDELNFG